jgi:hypothetical protein
MATRHGVRPAATTALVALMTLAALVATWAGSLQHASAHGGDLQIDLGTDGAGGIDALVVWAGDQHPVEETVDVTVEAVSDGGEEIGPVRLMSAPEGVGWYRSEPGLLAEGHWTITARTTEPSEHEVTTEVDVVALPEPSAAADEAAGPEAGGAGADGATDSGAGDGQAAAGGAPWVWILGGIGGVAVVGVLLLLRRRRTSA